VRVIETKLDSDIHVRGNEITITGAPADNAIACGYSRSYQNSFGPPETHPDAVGHA
jgi:hypothetical protein